MATLVGIGGAVERKPTSSGPELSTGSLNTSTVVTADPSTHPSKTLSETLSISNTLQTTKGSSIHVHDAFHVTRNGSLDSGSSKCRSNRGNTNKEPIGSNLIPGLDVPCTTEPTREIETTGFTAFTPNAATNAQGNQIDMDTSVLTASARGRGKGRGRPRGTGRGRGGARKGTRGVKREPEDEDDLHNSDSSEVYTPIATTTKSGRSVQKPTSYVPPPVSPVSSNKRKRTYRKNPESAVCKVCLRGTSPSTNMIVFCDGCNTPYHRYCHHPPIDQKVVDEVDMEWFCRQCEKKRFVPVPDSEVADFVSTVGSSFEERQRYFSRLKPGVLVTLLTRASTLQPNLPLFDPEFGSKYAANRAMAPPDNQIVVTANGSASSSSVQPSQAAPVSQLTQTTQRKSRGYQDDGVEEIDDEESDNEGYDRAFHPPHYPKPGQGLMATLPPDKDDAQWLVDDDDKSGAFTHFYQDNAVMANAGIEARRGVQNKS